MERWVEQKLNKHDLFQFLTSICAISKISKLHARSMWLELRLLGRRGRERNVFNGRSS